jgi:Flp pilus assembly pilin Flp
MTLHTRRRFSHPSNEIGQTMSEYSVLVGLIAVVVVVALPEFAAPIRAFYASVAGVLGL